MYNPPGDPRFPPGPRPHAGPPSYGAASPPYPQQPQAQQQAAPQGYGQAGQQAYGQQPGQQAYGQPPAPQAYVPPPQPNYGAPTSYNPPPPQQQASPSHAPSFGLPGMGGMGGLAGAGLGKMGAALPQLSGMPSVFAFGFGLIAVVLALVFDVIFLKIHIPGVGGYAWYLTTALSFAGAGWASIKWTKASKTVAMTALGVAAALYGVADLGLGLVLEDLSMAGAMMLGAQGVAIALFTGFGGVFKAMRDRDE